MPRYRIFPYTRAQLDAMANPSGGPKQPEAFADELWDTQNFVNASTTSLQFFQTAVSDKTLSNLTVPGQLPQPQYFLIHYVTVDILFPATTNAAAVAGNLNDVHILVNAARATLTLSIATKPYGPWRVRSAHSGGAPVGFFTGGAAAPATMQYGHIGPHDGGFCVNGGLIIPPATDFNVLMNFAAVQTLNTNNLPIQVGLYGVRYRKVA
jgi:hypothetical protein